MPTINVSLKEGASADQLDAAKKQCSDQGGKIVHEFKLVKGFTYVTPPNWAYSSPVFQDVLPEVERYRTMC
ncbi:hypothetical protein D0859_12627 [Hortaea werneckii]|uniref:Inhibitor I9 domain-containing protein n=1 Tax=Hortaea werneckii TaxID=91943 RepID=A0A3M7ICS4_HORWE|nr:hypothetical protein D0859_12627 [Hortaea werneckii]